jgi:GT2 family glycosyltransferase
MAAEPLRLLMTEMDDMAALVVHDDDEDCTCLAGVDRSTPWLERISFVETHLRRGRVYALNTALRRALGRDETSTYFLFLERDVVVEVGAINALRNVLLEQAHVGVVASRVVDAEGLQQPTVFRFPTFGRTATIGRSLADHTGAVPWVSTACIMVRRDVLDQIGLFDDTLYDGFQAADFCRRAALAGWQTWLVSTSTVTSSMRRPFGFEHTPVRDRPLYLASRDRFLTKNYGRFGAWWSTVGSVTRSVLTLWRRSSRDQLRELWRYHLRPRWPAPPGAPDEQ